jgi:hypothetical protein
MVGILTYNVLTTSHGNKYAYINLKRDRTIYMTRLLMLSLFVPFICAFLGHMKTDQQSIQDRIGLMYQSVGVPTYVGIFTGAIDIRGKWFGSKN